MKNILKIIWLFVIYAISFVLLFIDRLLMAVFINVELPGAKEINKFDHYKNDVAKRAAYYLIISLLVLLCWLIYKLTF